MLSEEGKKGAAAAAGEGDSRRDGDASQHHQVPTEGGCNELEAVANVIGKGPEELLRFVRPCLSDGQFPDALL